MTRCRARPNEAAVTGSAEAYIPRSGDDARPNVAQRSRVAGHLVAVAVAGHTPWFAHRRKRAERRDHEAVTDRCVECNQSIGTWGCWYSDGAGELVPYCADCAKREFP